MHISHAIPDEILDLTLWSLLDHLDAPKRVGAQLRKHHRGDTNPEATLRFIFSNNANPIRRITFYRGMGVTSTKWLVNKLKERYQLEIEYDWSCHFPDQRPIDVLYDRLDKVTVEIIRLESERRSLKSIINKRLRAK